jgi:hypothetical protein
VFPDSSFPARVLVVGHGKNQEERDEAGSHRQGRSEKARQTEDEEELEKRDDDDWEVVEAPRPAAKKTTKTQPGKKAEDKAEEARTPIDRWQARLNAAKASVPGVLETITVRGVKRLKNVGEEDEEDKRSSRG